MAKLQLFLLVEALAAAAAVLGQSAGDRLAANGTIASNQTLISAEGLFQLGFFNFSGSGNGYLGIRYYKLTDPSVVWVANRNKPLNVSTATLNLTADGTLSLFDNGIIIWSIGTSRASNPVLQLLDSGNLVLTAGNSNSPLWQSFDHPCDTLLPGMKLGVDYNANISRQLVSWKSHTDPSPGDYVFKMETSGVPEISIWSSSKKTYRTGPWTNQRFTGNPKMEDSSISNKLNFSFVSNQNEVCYTTEYKNKSLLSRAVMNASGRFERWNLDGGSWSNFWYVPEDECDHYDRCGSNSICTKEYYSYSCKCLKGFEVKGSLGCERTIPLSCSSDMFGKVQSIKLPDTENATADSSKSTLAACEDWCSKNCSCLAYAMAGLNGCVTWSGDLVDLRSFTSGGDDLYVRLAASEFESSRSKKRELAIGLPLLLGFLLLCCLSLLLWWRKRGKKQGILETDTESSVKETGLLLDLPKVMDKGCETLQQLSKTDFDTSEQHWSSNMINSENANLNNERAASVNILGTLSSYDLATIKAATNDFSADNKLGEGGFGVVYKGQLQDGQNIAVKKLSRHSSQGSDEFKNELTLIANLHHRNLVRLLGSCIEGDERLLVLEYMENGSLDAFIYDKTQSVQLNWQKRLEIIVGIARGLLYLHQDSNLRVIHRDLKPSNILLDKDMNPKISDFGIARIFERDEVHENATTRPVGTFGYMAPEYLSGGIFSFKSDVFSFGVIVLEILSGKRNRVFNQANIRLNLLGHAYKLWKEGRSLEILDDALDCSYPATEILRCIRMGLLCVQEHSEDRPTMAEVVMMLASEDQQLTPLKQPTITLAISDGGLSSKEISTNKAICYQANSIALPSHLASLRTLHAFLHAFTQLPLVQISYQGH
ncbi:S-locus lectin protein kinase family protein [Musa troglodytarum]|uniref:Receptor-like serine/threonine-protein kinase n=2 Tax=Musa troglodytarum TaxID=320322 RepID=A0A9E7H0I7_9LILI|nr:S-locus lectin protein kinase family protein [Musa troglodytarum]